MKKITSFLLAVCLMLSILPLWVWADEVETSEETTAETTEETTAETTAETTEETTAETTQPPAADNSCGDYLTWHYDSGILLIAGTGEMYDYEKGQEPWNAYKNTLSTLILDGEVTYIGAYAFYDYDKLVEIDFGTSLYEIGSYAFYDCDGLTELHMPDSFKIFEERCFSGASNLAAIHCQGRFPKFKESCLWDVYCKIYFPVERPWSVTNIADLEKAFKGRIEFLASDGSDPYTPEKETEATTAPTTEATTAPTTEPDSQKTPEVTTPSTTGSSTTQTTNPTPTPSTVPESSSQSQTQEQTQPQKEEKNSGNGVWIAVVIIGAVLIFVNLGMLLFQGKSKGQGRYHSRK